MSLIVPKGKTGLPRLMRAAVCSWRGVVAAFRHEDAFRMELLLALVLIPTALAMGFSAVEKALMVGSVLLVLLVELLNTGIEVVVDRISLEQHPLAARAKDIGSAAVGVSLVNLLAVWALILRG